MSRTREKTASLTARRVYHGCCPSLEHGLTGWCEGGMAGLCKAAAPGATVKDLVPTVQGLGERQSQSLPQELTVCVVPGPI